MQMPKTVMNCNLVPTHGKYSFDPTTRLLQWNVGKIELGKPPTIKGTVCVSSLHTKISLIQVSVSGTGTVETPPITVKFKINQLAVSGSNPNHFHKMHILGLKVNRLDMYGEKYKPFKGVKYITKAGKFQVRT